MDSDAIRKTDHRARALFTYKGDALNMDTWRSFADQVLAGDAWAGDCDDLASTILDLLGRDGLPLNRRYRLLIATQGDGWIDHQAACVQDDQGRFLMVGDTFGPAYSPPCISGAIRRYQRMDEWRGDGRPLWRDGAPFC